MRAYRVLAMAILMILTLGGCQSRPPIHTVAAVDLKRFMGDWYVIANIPTIFEKNAFNAIETYRLDEDGSVETTFRFNKGAFDGPEKIYRSRAFVLDKDSNAHWGMQFVWPFKAEYRIVFLSDDYAQTIIGRSKRDYVWIMARAPSIPDTDYDRLLKLLESYGYDTGQVQKVPQQKPDEKPAG
ncbi:MAG: lipocalin family protein [Desulfobacterales bacterium]|jgi:apolipoprotein D and lipocalin family protein